MTNERESEDGYSCAFLPLISDPGEDERKRLFQPMTEELRDVLLQRKMRKKVIFE